MLGMSHGTISSMFLRGHMSAASTQCASYVRHIASVCICFTCTTVHTAVIELPIEGVPQKGANLCWAAVSEMVVNHFASTRNPVAQGQLAAYNFEERLTLDEIQDGNRRQAFRDLVQSCKDEPANCDGRGFPMLLGLTSDPTSAALDPEALMGQMRNNKPVLINWSFPETTTSGLPTFGHQLLVVGFDDDDDRVLVWDPWPYDLGPPSIPARGPEWIAYARYANPENAMGGDVTHVSELINVRPDAAAPVDPEKIPTASPVSPMAGQRLQPPAPRSTPISAPARAVSFEDAIRATESLSRSAEALKPKPAIRGRQHGNQDRTVDRPMPIVVLSPEDLLAPQIDLDRLLRRVTHTVLYPVLSREEVVGAYLAKMGSDGWAERGYASTEVTRRLVQQRRNLGGHASDFYVVAVPAYGTFFLARGVGASTQLTPIAKTTFSEVGRTDRADAILPRMAADMRADRRADKRD